MRAVLKVHRKGIIILPKRLREALGISNNDEVVAEVIGGKIVLRPLKPKIVDVNPEIVEELLREEYYLEKNRYAEMMPGEEASTRH